MRFWSYGCSVCWTLAEKSITVFGRIEAFNVWMSAKQDWRTIWDCNNLVETLRRFHLSRPCGCNVLFLVRVSNETRFMILGLIHGFPCAPVAIAELFFFVNFLLAMTSSWHKRKRRNNDSNSSRFCQIPRFLSDWNILPSGHILIDKSTFCEFGWCFRIQATRFW